MDLVLELSSGRASKWPAGSVTQSYPTLCDPTDCSPTGFSVHGILQARILEWIAIPFFRASSWPRDQTWVSCIGRWILYHWAIRESLTKCRYYIKGFACIILLIFIISFRLLTSGFVFLFLVPVDIKFVYLRLFLFLEVGLMVPFLRRGSQRQK